MESPKYILDSGTVVKTHDKLETTEGMFVKPENEQMRKPAVLGVIRGVLGGHGGDVYWVQHALTEVPAPYCFTEFELDAAGAADSGIKDILDHMTISRVHNS